MAQLLDAINGPGDLKHLSVSQLCQVANEVRDLILDTVSETGGHLASNLGATELAVALHYTFDFSEDRLIWDVGHQCYAHKILTGRKDKMRSLRQYGGIAGFPNPEESAYDPFLTSHAGTSISTGLGLAVGDSLMHRRRKIVCVIGDGAMSSGVAIEALNNAGDIRKNLIIILNHNQMSISPNVGALSHYLDQVRAASLYQGIKKEIGHFLGMIPGIGKELEHTLTRIKDAIRHGLLPVGTLFEALGLRYFGPVDGHDMRALLDDLALIKDLEGPILLHVVTQKGHGYPYSVEDPVKYHQLNPFDKQNGEPRKSPAPSYSTLFGETLLKLAEQDPRVVAITAAMAEGTGLTKFRDKFPDRFFDTGIAEQHAVAFAGGLAASGLKPFVAIYSTFLQRAYDQVFQEVCLQNLPVIFAVDRAGITGGDGATAQGNFDIAFLRSLPNITIMAPRDGIEFKEMISFAISFNSPAAIRYPRDSIPHEAPDSFHAPIKSGKSETLKDGSDVVLFALGAMVERAIIAARILEEQGISCGVVNARFVKPVDREAIREWTDKVHLVVTVEDHALAAGFGSAAIEAAVDQGIDASRIRRIGIPDRFIEHGPRVILLEKLGLHPEGIARTTRNFLKRTSSISVSF